MNKGLHFGAVDDRIGAESVLDMAQARRLYVFSPPHLDTRSGVNWLKPA